jgi:hypothetical protein
VLAKQGKKNVVKLEADPGIMAELKNIKCCTVNGSEFDLGFIARVRVIIICIAIMCIV